MVRRSGQHLGRPRELRTECRLLLHEAGRERNRHAAGRTSAAVGRPFMQALVDAAPDVLVRRLQSRIRVRMGTVMPVCVVASGVPNFAGRNIRRLDQHSMRHACVGGAADPHCRSSHALNGHGYDHHPKEEAADNARHSAILAEARMLRMDSAADRSAIAAFFNFVLLGIHAPDGHGMPHTQNSGQAHSPVWPLVSKDVG